MGGGVRASELGALYCGTVVHKRSRPKRHVLRYRVFSMLVDLDSLESLDQKLRFFSLNRFNFFSIRRSDFGPHDGSSPAEFLRQKARSEGVSEPITRIRMLAYPRMFGFAFNPITVYFLEVGDEELAMMVYEVRNTFGEHHFYSAQVDDDETVSHTAAKAFYVSPFNTLEGRYRFSIRPPKEEVFIGVTLSTDEGGLLTAYFEGQHRELTDAALLKLGLEYPFMTAKVLFAIHWEALKLWLKGVPPTLKLRRKSAQSSVPRQVKTTKRYE
ncbi:DUF1365 domain-containing protein [Devosia pacifica]|uniref:DUF1365 domain-containing protein n=1 Tax=Devosia pacifica TaxID=1335967 RepID=A0A918SFT0_9HYPH|nr:DUF1365 family protein [Devosia pacifica]GHA36898.1 DUF1365 domain-containing protein [Devosia pacifica]